MHDARIGSPMPQLQLRLGIVRELGDDADSSNSQSRALLTHRSRTTPPPLASHRAGR